MTSFQYQSWTACLHPSHFYICLPSGLSLTQTILGHNLTDHSQFEPVSDTVVHKYLATVQAWHIAQGWPPPLNEEDHNHMNHSLRGLINLQGCWKHLIRPPITLHMLCALKAALSLNEPFNACVWAICTCAFFGMLCLGETTVKLRAAFNASKHVKHCDIFFGQDMDRKDYIHIDLPSAKTAAPGEILNVFITNQGDVYPLEALHNLATVVPTGMTFFLLVRLTGQHPAHSKVKIHESYQSNHQHLGMGHCVWPLLSHWWHLILPSPRSLVWNCLDSWLLEIPSIQSLHPSHWTDSIKAYEQPTKCHRSVSHLLVGLGVVSWPRCSPFCWLVGKWLVLAPWSNWAGAHFPPNPTARTSCTCLYQW